MVAAFIKPIVALFLVAGIDIVCLIILGTQHNTRADASASTTHYL